MLKIYIDNQNVTNKLKNIKKSFKNIWKVGYKRVTLETESISLQEINDFLICFISHIIINFVQIYLRNQLIAMP